MNHKQRFALIWGTASFVLAIWLCFSQASITPLESTPAKMIMALVSTLTGLLGATIGEALRRFALPNSFFTTGGMASIIWTKLFWKLGPQVIGTGVGVFMGIAIGSVISGLMGLQ